MVCGMELEALNLPAVATGIVGLVGMFFYAYNDTKIDKIAKKIVKACKSYLHRPKHARKPGAHRFNPSLPYSHLRLDGSRFEPTTARMI